MILFTRSCCIICILPSQECLRLMRSSFSSSHSSLIYLPLSSHPYSPTPLPFTPDEPGQLKIYLPKKLLECLPKCSSLPKERHRWNTNEVGGRRTPVGDIHGSERQTEFFFFSSRSLAGDSSLVNVTLRDEVVAKQTQW